MKHGFFFKVMRVLLFAFIFLVVLFVSSLVYIAVDLAWPKQFVWYGTCSFLVWVCYLKVFGRIAWRRFCSLAVVGIVFGGAGWQIAGRIKCAPRERTGLAVSSSDKSERLLFLTDSVVLEKRSVERIEKETWFSLKEVKWVGRPVVSSITGYGTETTYVSRIEKIGFCGDVIFGVDEDGRAFIFQNKHVEFVSSQSEFILKLQLKGVVNLQMRSAESFFD